MKAFFTDNNIVTLSINDDDTVLTSCDVSGETAECFECTAIDADGNEFSLDVATHIAISFINDEW